MTDNSNHHTLMGLIQAAVAISRQQVGPKFEFKPFFLFIQDNQVNCAVGLVGGSDGAMQQFVEAIRQMAVTQKIRTGVLVDKVECDKMYAPTITPNSVLAPPSDFVMLACQSRGDAPTYLLAVERNDGGKFLGFGRTTQVSPVPSLRNLVFAPEGGKPEEEIENTGKNGESTNVATNRVATIFVMSESGEVIDILSPDHDPMPHDHRNYRTYRVAAMIKAANLEHQIFSRIPKTVELGLTNLHDMPILTTGPSALFGLCKQAKPRGRNISFYRELGYRKNGPLCTLPIRAKHILLKSKDSYHQKGNHVAQILGPDADTDFERKILTRDDHGWHYENAATVSEPGLFEIRSFDQFGKLVDSYTVFDGENKAEITLETARLLAPQLNCVDLKPIVAAALVANQPAHAKAKLRKMELCLWMLDCAQKMGQLEQRKQKDKMVYVRPELPIKVFPRSAPEWVGFTHPKLCGKRWEEFASQDTPDFNELMTKPLNQLPPSELAEIAKYLCNWLAEDQIIRRVLAVVNHADSSLLPNLQKVVDLTENFSPKDYPPIVKNHYQRFLRLALDQNCKVHPKQTQELL